MENRKIRNINIGVREIIFILLFSFSLLLMCNSKTYAETKIVDLWPKYVYSKYFHTDSIFDWYYYERNIDRNLVGSEWQYPSSARLTFIVDKVPMCHYIYTKGKSYSIVRKNHQTWTSNTKAYGFLEGSSLLIYPSKFEELKKTC